MMTCLLFSLERSKHVHFIDGSNGGFAIAARQLKQQIKVNFFIKIILYQLLKIFISCILIYINDRVEITKLAC